MDTGIHKIHLFHASDLHFHFSTNTKARWWILKSTKQVKCWIRCIYHCTKHQPQQREGVLFKAIIHILYINNTKWVQREMTVKYSLPYFLGNPVCKFELNLLPCFCDTSPHTAIVHLDLEDTQSAHDLRAFYIKKITFEKILTKL